MFISEDYAKVQFAERYLARLSNEKAICCSVGENGYWGVAIASISLSAVQCDYAYGGYTILTRTTPKGNTYYVATTSANYPEKNSSQPVYYPNKNNEYNTYMCKYIAHQYSSDECNDLLGAFVDMIFYS